MNDPHLHQLMIRLADAIREFPECDEHQAIVDRFFAVVAHLQSKDLIDRSGSWNLSSLRRGHG
jgi:hypothetical protein